VKPALAEAIGTALLLAAVVGSGIMGEGSAFQSAGDPRVRLAGGLSMALVQVSTTVRAGVGQWSSEVVATFGLVMVILSCDRGRPWSAPVAVGAYIAAAYWFTASTSFANPAVTVARGFTATFSGIEPSGIPAFVLAQLAGGALAAAVMDPERAAR
jgi:glycerol uptake facilitator-like aquaporin